MQVFKFQHFMKKPVTYQVKVDRADGTGVCDFKLEGQPTVQAPAADSFKGVECLVNIRYEPFTIGDSRGILKLTSPEGIEYNAMLLVVLQPLNLRAQSRALSAQNQLVSTSRILSTRNLSSLSLLTTSTSRWRANYQAHLSPARLLTCKSSTTASQTCRPPAV